MGVGPPVYADAFIIRLPVYGRALIDKGEFWGVSFEF